MNEFKSSRLYRSRSKKNTKLRKLIIGVIVLIIFHTIYFGFFVKPAVQSENIALVTINEGDSVKTIAKKLKKENVINSKILFRLYTKFSGEDRNLKSGVFRIPLPQNIKSTAFFIANNIPEEQRLTIPEGYKVAQIDQLLSEKGLISSGEFISCTKSCDIDHEILNYIPNGKGMEGFLFPDTYFISTENFTSEELIVKMLNNFESKLPENWQSQASKLPETDLYTVINMASIIEREVLSQEDKKLVSGILWKRYENSWPLGADATLLYEKADNIITADDLQKDSPYNTRKFQGFPPTPISNPGVESIIAALEPKSSQYWFYLTTLDTGEVIYAVTNEQHNQNKAEHL